MPRSAETFPPGRSAAADRTDRPSPGLLPPGGRWEAPGADLSLKPGGLAVFQVPVTPGSGWEALLSDADRAERCRWRRPADQARFTAARGALRAILARVLGDRQPDEIRLLRTPRGRLHLDPAGGDAGLDFNLSHAGDLVLIALCARGRVGVDIECGDRPLDIDGIARLVLTAGEQERLAACRDAVERRELFFTCWVRKEAVAKADGRGLACGLRRLPVLDGAAAGSLVAVIDEAGTPRSWRVIDIPVPAVYRGALATDLPGGAPRLYLAAAAALWPAVGDV